MKCKCTGQAKLDAELRYLFEEGLQDLCERLNVAIRTNDAGGYGIESIYLERTSAPTSDLVIDPRVRDATVYEVNDDAPDGAREGFEE